MKKLLASNKGTLLAYGLIMLTVLSLSLFLLFAGIYEVSAVLAISGSTTFAVLAIMLYGNLNKSEDGMVKPGSFIALSVLRFVLLAAGIALSAVLLYLTNSPTDTKFRLFYSLLSIVPMILSMTLYAIRGRSE